MLMMRETSKESRIFLSWTKHYQDSMAFIHSVLPTLTQSGEYLQLPSPPFMVMFAVNLPTQSLPASFLCLTGPEGTTNAHKISFCLYVAFL